MSNCEENPGFEYNEMNPPRDAEPDHIQEDEPEPTTSVCNALTITLSFFVGILSILIAVLFILHSQIQSQALQVPAQIAEIKQELYLTGTKLSKIQSEISRLKTAPTNWYPEFGHAFDKNKRYHKTLGIGRWMKFSNGLAYKLCVSEIDIDFANAEKECKDQEAQLASTGFRNSTIRREIFTRFSKSKKNIWIGLNQPYDNTTWVWSDGKLYDNADMPWDSRSCSRSCSTMRGLHGAIDWSYDGIILSCYQSIANIDGYICEK